MYASYVYNSGATAANILADVIAILTGTTDVNSLSASCNKTTSTITAAARAAGWTVHDASAGTNAQCLKAAVDDDATKYKFMVVDTNTSSYIHFKLYDSWNETTHAGTNKAYYSDLYSQKVNTTSGGQLEISASARHCFVWSIQGGTYGGSYGPGGIFERTRLSPWDTVANGYLPAVYVLGVQSYSSECKRVNASGMDAIGTNAVVNISHVFGCTNGGVPPTNPSAILPSDANKALKHAMIPFGCSFINDGHLGGDFSTFADVWLTTYGNGQALDTLTYNSNQYVIWTIGTSWRFAVRKG